MTGLIVKGLRYNGDRHKLVLRIVLCKLPANDAMPPSISSSHARTQGFSLIELLIALSVISLLMGMLIPTMRVVRDKAKTLSCLSNIRNVGMAMLNKAAENRQSLDAPRGKTVDYSFISRSGTPVSFQFTYPGGYRGDLFGVRNCYASYGFVYDLRTNYDMVGKVNRCPSDPTPLGGNHQKQSWSWTDANLAANSWDHTTNNMDVLIASDPEYYSSYWPNWLLIWNRHKLTSLHAPGLTFLLTDTTIPNASWEGQWGPNFTASIHSRGRNYHLGETDCYRGLSVFADGHTEMWDWQRCAYVTPGTLELTANPDRVMAGAEPLPGVPRPDTGTQGGSQNLRY